MHACWVTRHVEVITWKTMPPKSWELGLRPWLLARILIQDWFSDQEERPLPFITVRKNAIVLQLVSIPSSL